MSLNVSIPKEENNTDKNAPKTFVEHLLELRSRLLMAVAAIVLATAISYLFKEHVMFLAFLNTSAALWYAARSSRREQHIGGAPEVGISFLFCLFSKNMFLNVKIFDHDLRDFS